MRAWTVWGLVLASGPASVGCPAAHPPPEVAVVPPAPLPPLDPNDAASVAAHLVLPAQEEPGRERYGRELVRAGATVRLFATAHGWAALVPARPYEAIEVSDGPEALWVRLSAVCGAPDAPPPAVLPDAALCAGRLLLLSEGAYRRHSPAYAAPADAWRRLAAHELAHALHVAILAADGLGEDAMGPRWFYEGFAGVASGQDLDLHTGIAYPDVAAALDGVAGGDPATAYARYAAAVRRIAREVPLREVVARAGAPDFDAWLRSTAPAAEVAPPPP